MSKSLPRLAVELHDRLAADGRLLFLEPESSEANPRHHNYPLEQRILSAAGREVLCAWHRTSGQQILAQRTQDYMA